VVKKTKQILPVGAATGSGLFSRDLVKRGDAKLSPGETLAQKDGIEAISALAHSWPGESDLKGEPGHERKRRTSDFRRRTEPLLKVQPAFGGKNHPDERIHQGQLIIASTTRKCLMLWRTFLNDEGKKSRAKAGEKNRKSLFARAS